MPAFSAQPEKLGGLMVEALPLVCIPERFAHDSPYHARTEVVRVIESIDCGHHSCAIKAGIFDMRKLVTFRVRERQVSQKAILDQVVMQLRTGISVRDRDLNRLGIQFSRKVKRPLNSRLCLARKADDALAIQ